MTRFSNRPPSITEETFETPTMNRTHPIGQTAFTDGLVRIVHRRLDGRQFVLDDGGQPVFGLWIRRGPDGKE
jgi:hypothetical protein